MDTHKAELVFWQRFSDFYETGIKAEIGCAILCTGDVTLGSRLRIPSRDNQCWRLRLFTGSFASYVDSVSAVQGWYDISLDGEHFLMIENTSSPSDVELHVILNGDEELKRLVPSTD